MEKFVSMQQLSARPPGLRTYDYCHPVMNVGECFVSSIHCDGVWVVFCGIVISSEKCTNKERALV